MGRQEIRAREADGSSASATPSVRLLSLRPLHNIVELETVLVPEPGQRTSVWAVIDRYIDRCYIFVLVILIIISSNTPPK